MALPVNFKDDVLASSMDGKRRYNMITNSDGTVSFEDVTTYSQEGSNFGSAQINNTNGAINTINNNVLDTIEQISANTSSGKFAGALALKNVNNSFGGMKFGIDSDGNYGYIKAGADTVTPFSGKLTDLISKNHLSPYFAKTVVQAYALFEYDANSGYMKLTRTGTGKCTVYGGILVDVTKYKSIKLTVKNKSVSNGTITVGISKNSSSDQQEFYSESTGTTVVFDLTSYSGNYYIGIRNFAFNSSLLIEKLELS